MGGANPTWQWSTVSGPSAGTEYGGPEGGYSGSAGEHGGAAGRSISAHDEIMNRYREFAETGGYSPETLGAIRSRALSPVRAAYSDANRAIDRGRSLAGGYSPNYAAARSRTAREQAYANADATTNVEAALGEMVQRGRMGGIGGMSSVYGQSPGLAATFGQQALANQAFRFAAGGGNRQGDDSSWWQNIPWGGIATGVGTAIAASSKKFKHNIKEPSILDKLKDMPIKEWSYNGEDKRHVGPMAEDFHKTFGGSGSGINITDYMGVTLGAIKELTERVQASKT
jgi:hypothetical protein